MAAGGHSSLVINIDRARGIATAHLAIVFLIGEKSLSLSCALASGVYELFPLRARARTGKLLFIDSRRCARASGQFSICDARGIEKFREMDCAREKERGGGWGLGECSNEVCRSRQMMEK